MLHLFRSWEHLIACSLREPILAEFWKGLIVFAMTTECQSMRKSVAYLGTAECLPPGMSGQS